MFFFTLFLTNLNKYFLTEIKYYWINKMGFLNAFKEFNKIRCIRFSDIMRILQIDV
jgi:hypothetical protein